MQIALGAKSKLGFIDGRVLIPQEDSDEFELWKGCDYMTTSQLLNSISEDLVNAFIYTTNAKKVWDGIIERFEESNGPFLYQLQCKIVSITQDNLSISIYYTQLKKL